MKKLGVALLYELAAEDIVGQEVEKSKRKREFSLTDMKNMSKKLELVSTISSKV